MMKSFVILACFGIVFSWMSVSASVNPTIADSQKIPASTPATLLILGSGLSVLALWGKRPKNEG